MKSQWKESETYRFSRSVSQNPLRRPTMVANIFEDFQPPSKRFLVAPPTSLFIIPGKLPILELPIKATLYRRTYFFLMQF